MNGSGGAALDLDDFLRAGRRVVNPWGEPTPPETPPTAAWIHANMRV